MLKKITILILTCLFAMTALSGCSIIAEQNEKSLIENALKERYGEEFVCMRTWNNAADGYYSHSFYGLCYPKNDEGLLFEVLSDSDGVLLIDEYASALASQLLKNEFDKHINVSIGEQHYTRCLNYGVLEDTNTATIIQNNQFSLEYFFKENLNNNENNQFYLYFTVCIDDIGDTKDYSAEYDAFTKTLNHIYVIGLENGIDLQIYVDLYFVSSDIYDIYIDYMKSNAKYTTSFHHLLDDKVKQQKNQKIDLDLKSNFITLTKENYINQREELD